MLLNPSVIYDNKYFEFIFLKASHLGIGTVNEFIFFIGLMTFFIFVTSQYLRILNHYKQLQFTFKLEEDLSKFIMKSYLSLPYSWFLNKNSTDLGKNVLSEVSHVVSGTLMPALTLLSQSIIIILLLLLLFASNPVATFFILVVMGSSYIFIFIILRNFLKKFGKNRFESNKKRFLIANEAFSAIKDIKFNKIENFFINRFGTQVEIFANSQFLFQGVSNIPKYIIEGLAFGGMIILVLFLISQDAEMLHILPYLAMYVFAGYRLMPAMQQIFSSLSQLKYIRTSLNELHKDLIFFESQILQESKKSEIKENHELKITKNISLKNINFYYPKTNKLVLQDLSIKIPLFKKTAIVGPTGAGKTTIVDIILGLLQPTDGNIMVDDNLISTKNADLWRNVIGYVPQQVYLSDNSFAYNIAFGKDNKDIDWELLKSVSKVANIHDFIVNNYSQGYNTFIGDRGARLSGGQKQRIGIARALYKKPKIIILDEGTNALDSVTEKSIIDSIDKLSAKVTTIVITHRLNTIKNFDIIYLINNGKLEAQGNYHELIDKSDIFRKMAAVD